MVTKRETWHPLNRADWQPEVWSAMFFTNDDDRVLDVVETLAVSVKERWYIDITAGRTRYVVFRNRIFGYDRNDKVGKANAIEYGIKAGIPQSQLDWPD